MAAQQVTHSAAADSSHHNGSQFPRDGKIAFITGITGQDGSYLAELLLSKNYVVHGMIRRSSSFNTGRLDHIYKDPHTPGVRLFLHYGDMQDGARLRELIELIRPDEVYNLAAQSHVKVSFDIPEQTEEINAQGVSRLLLAIKSCGLLNTCKFYQASTSELYGKILEERQSETTPFNPQSPYANSKQTAFFQVKFYRDVYGMHASNGILFNHESPRRGPTFVTRKTTMAVARIAKGLQDCLYMGNIDAKRDWGHARDYVEGMWMMLQQEKPDDYVLALGETHPVRDMIVHAFNRVGITITWHGKGTEEEGRDANGRTLVKIDPRYFRPAEVEVLLGNPAKAHKVLGWKPKCSFEELINEMVDSDLEAAGHIVRNW